MINNSNDFATTYSDLLSKHNYKGLVGLLSNTEFKDNATRKTANELKRRFQEQADIEDKLLEGTDDNTSDYISEALMKSVIHSSLVAVKNPNDYEARSNIMWTATWALNTLIAKGKTTDWEVHMLGQAVGAYTDAREEK